MATYKAVLIDPFTQSVTDTTLAGDKDYGKEFVQSVYKATECDVYTVVRFDLGGKVANAFLDDEGLLKDWDHQAFYQCDLIYPNVLAGKTIILGETHDPETYEDQPADAPEGLADAIRKSIRWVDAKNVRVPAPTFTSFKPDGTQETGILGKTETWDYDNQP